MPRSKKNVWKEVLPNDLKIQSRNRMGWSLGDDELHFGQIPFVTSMEHAVNMSRQQLEIQIGS